MGIADIIRQKKNEFFVARDSDKRILQRQSLLQERDRLERERVEVADIRRIQAEISEHKKVIHQDMTSGSSKIAHRIGQGFREFGESVKKFDRPEVNKSPFRDDNDRIKPVVVDEHPFRRNR